MNLKSPTPFPFLDSNWVMVLSVCWNAVLTSYPSFCFNAGANVLANDDDEKKYVNWTFTQLHTICLAHVWKRFYLSLRKSKKNCEKPCLYASPFSTSNLKLRTGSSSASCAREQIRSTVEENTAKSPTEKENKTKAHSLLDWKVIVKFF